MGTRPPQPTWTDTALERPFPDLEDTMMTEPEIEAEARRWLAEVFGRHRNDWWQYSHEPVRRVAVAHARYVLERRRPEDVGAVLSVLRRAWTATTLTTDAWPAQAQAIIDAYGAPPAPHDLTGAHAAIGRLTARVNELREELAACENRTLSREITEADVMRCAEAYRNAQASEYPAKIACSFKFLPPLDCEIIQHGIRACLEAFLCPPTPVDPRIAIVAAQIGDNAKADADIEQIAKDVLAALDAAKEDR